MFPIIQRFLVTPMIPTSRRLYMILPRSHQASRLWNCFWWKKFSGWKKGSKFGDNSTSCPHSDFPNLDQSSTGLEPRVTRLEDKAGELSQVASTIDGGVATIKMQNSVLLIVLVGTGGAILAWLIKEKLSENPKRSDLETMVKEARAELGNAASGKHAGKLSQSKREKSVGEAVGNALAGTKDICPVKGGS